MMKTTNDFSFLKCSNISLSERSTRIKIYYWKVNSDRYLIPFNYYDLMHYSQEEQGDWWIKIKNNPFMCDDNKTKHQLARGLISKRGLK